AELAQLLRFYVCDDIEPSPKAAQAHLRPGIAPALQDLTDSLDTLARWDAGTIEEAFQRTIAMHNLALGKLAQPVRVAVTGGTGGPGTAGGAGWAGAGAPARARARGCGAAPPGPRHACALPPRPPSTSVRRVFEEWANW